MIIVFLRVRDESGRTGQGKHGRVGKGMRAESWEIPVLKE